jgi:hypothetical protein
MPCGQFRGGQIELINDAVGATFFAVHTGW